MIYKELTNIEGMIKLTKEKNVKKQNNKAYPRDETQAQLIAGA